MLSTLFLVVRFAVMMLAATYIGRENQLNVRIPRLTAEVTVDGVLNEPVWQQADVLTGFSEFSPHDGIPAADSTQVLVWYSPTALHFGIRAFEPHGAVHATLADRDKIASDDNVQILLGTFHDHRQAYVFGVNPLGVQMDGTIVEQGQVLTGGWTPTLSGRVAPDLSQDFVFDSKGRLTDYGYEVEIRGEDGRPLAARSWYDTESLAEADGALYVGIERVEKIVRFDYVRDGLGAPVQPIEVPADFKTFTYNKSLECLAAPPQGSPLADPDAVEGPYDRVWQLVLLPGALREVLRGELLEAVGRDRRG